MGCTNSSLTSVVPAIQPEYAIERFAEEKRRRRREPPKNRFGWQPRNGHQSDDSRRKPLLKVPEKVIAPYITLNDIGGHDYRSMHASPKVVSPAMGPSRQISGTSSEIDDIEEPPNHETQAEYISILDTFMTDVNVNPEQLQKTVREWRTAMCWDSEDDKDVDIPEELYEQRKLMKFFQLIIRSEGSKGS